MQNERHPEEEEVRHKQGFGPEGLVTLFHILANKLQCERVQSYHSYSHCGLSCLLGKGMITSLCRGYVGIHSRLGVTGEKGRVVCYGYECYAERNLRSKKKTTVNNKEVNPRKSTLKSQR